MDKIVLLDPSIGSLNMGDHIISHSARHQLSSILEGAFVASFSTHTPSSLYFRHVSDARLRFALGSNLLAGKIRRLTPHWDVTLGKAFLLSPVVLVGVGWRGYGDEVGAYSKAVYRRVLSGDIQHSVRDSFTLHQMERAGFKNVINTGCATMWDLTPEHCATINRAKANSVVTTVTDYNRDPVRDRRMLQILLDSYQQVSLWVQGYSDAEYAAELQVGLRKFSIIEPSIDKFDNALLGGADFVGTRLHAGIRALQLGRRSVIVAIDNRATEKQRDFNIVCVQRDEIDDLAGLINSDFDTKIRIPVDAISAWKSQFTDVGPLQSESSRRGKAELLQSGVELYRQLRDGVRSTHSRSN